MPASSPKDSKGTILLIGASRGLGHAMAAELLKRGWNVTGTVRHGKDRTPFHALADANPGRVEIEHVDINEPEQIASLRGRLSERRFDILFVNAGIVNANPNEPLAQVSTEEFTRLMLTNALSPIRTIEALQDLVRADGLIGAMSSGLGSIANNTSGGFEVYRGSKSALNQYMRTYAARNAAGRRSMVLIAPGWIRTDMGGPNAPLGIEEAIPLVVDVLLAKQGKPGLEYLDRMGNTVPW